MRKIILLLVNLCILMASQSAWPMQSVVLQLKWDHEFQFAGFYAAEHMGYYEDAGLAVEIRSRVNEDNSLKDVFAELESGRAQFALSGPDLIIAAEAYPSIRVAATLMQESPMVFVAREGEFVSPAEFVGKRIVNAEPLWGPVEIHAVMQAVGSRQTTLEAENLAPDLALLTSGKVDLIMTYAPSAYWQAKEAGRNFDYFSAREYGVHFYGDTLVVDDNFAQKNPELTEKFISASLRGWEYAMRHQDEISRLIAAKYSRRFDWYEDFAAYNLFEAGVMSGLMLYPTVEIGHSSRERWQRTIKYFYDAGFIKSELDASDLLLDLHKDAGGNTYWYFVTILSMLALGIIGGLFALLWVRMLRSKVREKTSELAELNSNLEYLVEARTEELVAEKDRAEEASRAKDKLVANVSHELRTPMNAIIGFSELAMRDKSINDERGYFLRINASAKSLLSIINDLLDFSKIDADKLELDVIQFDLHTLLKHCAEVFTFGAAEKGLQYSFTLGPQLPRLVTGDPARLQQILTNVIGNAIKFTPHGHVSVSANLLSVDDIDEKEGVSQSTRCRINFVVEDSGIGIDSSQIEKMFQPFSQADASITRMFGGTGLGLTITRYLVNLMQGAIAVVSEKGQGARFEVTIPFEVSASEISCASTVAIGDVAGDQRPGIVSTEHTARMDAGGGAGSDGDADAPWSGKSALLVEDNDFNAEVARGFIEYQGLSFERVSDGPSALELLATRRAAGAPDFDMIFMDIQMPGWDGFETTQKIQQAFSDYRSPIVAMTAHATTGYREYCIEQGMTDYLSKPLDEQVLRALFLKYLGAETMPSTADFTVELAEKNNDAAKLLTAYSVLDSADGLKRLRGKTDIYKKLLGKYLLEAKEIDNLCQKFDQRDWAQVAFLAHAIKGSASTLSLKRLSEVARRIEVAIKNGKTSTLQNLVDELRDSWASTETEIRRYIV